MLNLITDKEEIVRKILPLIPDTEISDFDYAMKTWWKNIRSSGGMGLTVYGDQMFRAAELEYYDFDLGQASHFGGMGTSLRLDKYMMCPYYFYFSDKRKLVRIYDSRLATMIMLKGNIFEYMENVKKRKQENDND